MAGVGEFIRKSRLERLEDHQVRVDRVTVERLNELRAEIATLQAAVRLLYQVATDRTWRGRFRGLVAWLSKPDKQKTVQRTQKEEPAGRGIVQEPERAGGTQ